MKPLIFMHHSKRQVEEGQRKCGPSYMKGYGLYLCYEDVYFSL